MNLPLSILLVFLLALLTLVSYVDRLYHEMGKFLSREFEENIEAYEQLVEPRLGFTRERASLSMAMLTQLSMASIGVLIGYLLFIEQRWVALDLVQAAVSLVFIIVIFNRLLPRYVEIQVYRALLESAAAEHGARMASMDSASRNAGDMIDILTLNMNRIRQAAITREIIEVVSGAGAL